LPKIVISDFNFIDDSASYYNRYRLYDKEHDSLFTDKIEFVILELRKLSTESDHSERWNWAKFFNSKTDAELRVAAAKNERIAKAMLTIEKLSEDEAARIRAEYKEMQDLDHISRMEGADITLWRSPTPQGAAAPYGATLARCCDPRSGDPPPSAARLKGIHRGWELAG
jgi:hypothetical protein